MDTELQQMVSRERRAPVRTYADQASVDEMRLLSFSSTAG